jgi:transcriptional regulator with XRE-family HTH domain
MTTALKFRNLDASPDDPVETWPFEGILAAVERGTLPDWRRLATAIRADPWGPVAQQVQDAVRLSRPYGTTELLERVVLQAREQAIESEREDVASEVRGLVVRSGLATQDFAARIGTSRSRLSTYMSGKVVPAATLMVRMRKVASTLGSAGLPVPGTHSSGSPVRIQLATLAGFREILHLLLWRRAVSLGPGGTH